jgi:hypothetical protein
MADGLSELFEQERGDAEDHAAGEGGAQRQEGTRADPPCDQAEGHHPDRGEAKRHQDGGRDADRRGLRSGDGQEQHQAAGAAQDAPGDDLVRPPAVEDIGDHDREQQVEDEDRLHQGQRPEVQGERLHHRAGNVDGDPDHPEPVGRQVGEQLQVKRRPFCHLVGGALLDDVGCAERDGTRDRNDHGERLIHNGSLTRSMPH